MFFCGTATIVESFNTGPTTCPMEITQRKEIKEHGRCTVSDVLSHLQMYLQYAKETYVACKGLNVSHALNYPNQYQINGKKKKKSGSMEHRNN